MPATYNILMMGASYGSLLASKLLFGGHKIHLVCLPAEAELINAEGFRVRLPVRGRKDPVVLDSRKLPGQGDGRRRRRRQSQGLRPRRPGHAGAAVPLARRARAARRGGQVARALHVDHEHAAAALREAHPRPRLRRRCEPPTPTRRVWDSFDPDELTLNSPDPQAIRPPEEKVNVLHGHAADQLQGRRGSTTTSTPRSCASSRRTSRRRASTRRKARSSCR